MKKLITLILLLTGMVCTVSAAENVYLYGDNIGWENSTTTHPFTKISNNEFRILINSDWVTNKSFYFRFIVDGSYDHGVNGNDFKVTTNDYGLTSGETYKALYISSISEAASKLIYIKVTYKNSGYGDKWHVCYYTRDVIEHTINFTKNNEDWGGDINLYAWDSDGVELNGKYPGTAMSRIGEKLYIYIKGSC